MNERIGLQDERQNRAARDGMRTGIVDERADSDQFDIVAAPAPDQGIAAAA